ncbi:MAG: hypothetical protein OP8BY_0725 [Candidatus Saccharicenans subterraneus]|uniref:Uncharacterized protein n=1 Tax=Candidatus Saccharicenans subterraneus TaxID=2508984 RepID=A0A3E2BK78_9BACT|nr:MAG: hypothetical protein OP8BY_0725 [Candidatus Saccharicenans subterraneum]
MSATNWQWVGTLTLSSNLERKDYVDLETIVYDRAGRTITYRVLSIVTEAGMTTRTYTRYLTSLETGYKTKVLDFQVHDAEDRQLMFTKEGWEDPTWEEPEELSLLQRAIDMVLEKLEGNGSGKNGAGRGIN